MRMDLLKFKIDNSKTLYFNQYKYKVCLQLTGVHMTRSISTIEKFNERVAKRNSRINNYMQAIVHGIPTKNLNSDSIVYKRISLTQRLCPVRYNLIIQ